jgi:uncharacterized protein YkwD
MKIIFGYVFLACVVLLAGVTAAAQSNNNSLVQQVFDQTNQFRRSKGLPKLELRTELNNIAKKHSANMASGRVAFGHQGFAQRSAGASAAIQAIRSFAENVAYGAASAKEVMNLWKNSPGHRSNMLGHYRYTGIGTATDKHGQIYYTQVFGG